MKASRYLAMILALTLFGATAAMADVIPISTFTLPDVIGNPSAEANWIETNQGLAYDLTFLFKMDNDTGAIPGALDGRYFTISGTGTPTATISWNLAGSGYELYYILVKDGDYGNNGFDGKLYSLYGVTLDQRVSSNGDQTVGFFVPGGYIDKGISHISFYGVEGQTYNVPEPATLLLLGTGFAIIGLVYRKRIK